MTAEPISRYDGPEYGPETEPEDAAKYSRVMKSILALMFDGKARSKAEIRDALGLDPDTEVSARLRDLRKPQYGALKVICNRNGDGVYRYRLARSGE